MSHWTQAKIKLAKQLKHKKTQWKIVSKFNLRAKILKKTSNLPMLNKC